MKRPGMHGWRSGHLLLCVAALTTGCDYEEGIKEFERLCNLPNKNKIYEIVYGVDGLFHPSGASPDHIYPSLMKGEYKFIEVFISPKTAREVLNRFLLVDDSGLHRYELMPREDKRCGPFIKYMEEYTRIVSNNRINSNYCVAASKIDRPISSYEIKDINTTIVYGSSDFWGTVTVSTFSTLYIRRETGEIVASRTGHSLQAYRMSGTRSAICTDKTPAVWPQAILKSEASPEAAPRN